MLQRAGRAFNEGCSGQIALSGVIPIDALENQDETARGARLFLRFDSRHKTAWNSLIPIREPDCATEAYESHE